MMSGNDSENEKWLAERFSTFDAEEKAAREDAYDAAMSGAPFDRAQLRKGWERAESKRVIPEAPPPGESSEVRLSPESLKHLQSILGGLKAQVLQQHNDDPGARGLGVPEIPSDRRRRRAGSDEGEGDDESFVSSRWSRGYHHPSKPQCRAEWVAHGCGLHPKLGQRQPESAPECAT